MTGRRSDILSREQAEALLASLPLPSKCDACGKPLDAATRERHPYGPFTLHVCPGCKLILCRRRLRRESE